jgi:UDP-N-acetylglucosamine 3-dehydrogenase
MKVGVIGVGEMGQNHVRVYHELGAEIIGVSDLNEERARKIASQYETRAFTNYRELLSQGLDAVTIAVPTSKHKEVALAAISNGVNILVEKPIADSVVHGDEIITAAERAGLKLMVGHVERFNPVAEKLKDIIEEGTLGKVLLLSTRRVGPFAARISDAGIITDLATHDIDIARYIIAKEPVEVFTKLSNIRNKKGDCALIILDFGDTTASIEVNWFTPQKVRTLVATGTEGIAYVDYIEQTLEVHNAGWKMVPRFEKGEPLRLELEHFLECIKFDRQPLVTGYDGLKTLEIALEAEAMAQRTRIVGQ